MQKMWLGLVKGLFCQLCLLWAILEFLHQFNQYLLCENNNTKYNWVSWSLSLHRLQRWAVCPLRQMQRRKCWINKSFSSIHSQKWLLEICQKLVDNSKTVPKIFRANISMLLLLLSTSYIRSFIHSLIYSFTACPQRGQQLLLSCYSRELLKPPAMNNSKAENRVRMSVCLTPLWSFKKLFYLLLHIWWLLIYESNEGLFACQGVLDFGLIWILKAKLTESGTD